MPPTPIRVLLVDDSPTALDILKRILTSSPDIQVVGTARNGIEALQLIPQLQPTVICTDIHMPGMDGFELTRQVMLKYPRPVLALSSSFQKENAQEVFQVLEAGAVDVFNKPFGKFDSDNDHTAEELISKIKILSGVYVFHKRREESVSVVSAVSSKKAWGLLKKPVSFLKKPTSVRIVAIGASTGGPQALQTILRQLPFDFPVPILCVQHIGVGFLSGLVNWLASQCSLKVKIAQDGEFPLAGTIYFPQEGTHLLIDKRGGLVSSLEAPLEGHRPSITLTFKSIADHHGKAAVGILLTGMGKDGADGMKAIAKTGGITIVQDEKSSVVFGMPKQAIELGAAQYILPVGEIADTLITKIFPEKRMRYADTPEKTEPQRDRDPNC